MAKNNDNNEKNVTSLGAKVYNYTAGEFDVLADTKLENKIEEFRKKINELDDCYKEISNRIESLDGEKDSLWKSVHQKELYSYLKTSVTSTFSRRIDDWKTYREFLITVLQRYTDFDETYDKTIDENKSEFDVNETNES